jgi:hypothetical protein
LKLKDFFETPSSVIPVSPAAGYSWVTNENEYPRSLVLQFLMRVIFPAYQADVPLFLEAIERACW